MKHPEFIDVIAILDKGCEVASHETLSCFIKAGPVHRHWSYKEAAAMHGRECVIKALMYLKAIWGKYDEHSEIVDIIEADIEYAKTIREPFNDDCES